MIRQGRNERCACGSGRKYKRCCGVAGPAQQHPKPSGQAAVAPPTGTTTVNSLGLPGHVQHVAVKPIFPEPDFRNSVDPKGEPGPYNVIFTLARPGFSLKPERHVKFADQLVGDSHIAITRPACTAPEEADHIQFDLQFQGKSHRFYGYPNDRGYLARIELPSIDASNSSGAEAEAYKIVAPLLSGISLMTDSPVSIFQTDVTELRTSTVRVRMMSPSLDTVISRPKGGLEAELRGYASVYREGMNSNSPLYQFLCFYKIVEAVRARRDRLSAEAAAQGRIIRRPAERIPRDEADLKAWLRSVFPKHYPWHNLVLEDVVPHECRARKQTTSRRTSCDLCATESRTTSSRSLANYRSRSTRSSTWTK
jgi:hypothetical protein